MSTESFVVEIATRANVPFLLQRWFVRPSEYSKYVCVLFQRNYVLRKVLFSLPNSPFISQQYQSNTFRQNNRSFRQLRSINPLRPVASLLQIQNDLKKICTSTFSNPTSRIAFFFELLFYSFFTAIRTRFQKFEIRFSPC